MSNILSKLGSTKLAWFKKSPDTSGMDLAQVLDWFSKKQGVACDGAVNGLQYVSTLGTEPAGPLRAGLEVIDDTHYLVVRDCTGALVVAFTGITTIP